jgi:hypothetical protein
MTGSITLAGYAQDTARRDIEALISLGVLQKHTGAGRCTSYFLVLSDVRFRKIV